MGLKLDYIISINLGNLQPMELDEAGIQVTLIDVLKRWDKISANFVEITY